MQPKTIKAILAGKFKLFTDSIKNEEVKKLVQKNSMITGGCITSMLLNEEVNDFDIYFTNKETVKAVSMYYVSQFNDEHKNKHAEVLDGEHYKDELDAQESGKPVSGYLRNLTPDRIKIRINGGQGGDEAYVNPENPDSIAAETLKLHAERSGLDTSKDEKKTKLFRPVYLTSNSITLSEQIQLIIRFYGNPTEIHENYDFVHCTNYYLPDTDELALKPEAVIAILNKNLIYVGSKYPIASIIRSRKFIQRGWHISAGQYLKICYQISDLNLNDINVLEDQLVGVDVMAFNQLIQAMQDKINTGGSIDYGTLAAIVDRIF